MRALASAVVGEVFLLGGSLVGGYNAVGVQSLLVVEEDF